MNYFGNAPLICVYPNTIEKCLTPNNLLLTWQLLYSSNTTSIVVRKRTDLSSTSDKINHISNHFSDRWRHKYVVNLRETQQTSKLNINSLKNSVNDIVLLYDEKVPRHFWRIVIVTRVLPSWDSKIRCTMWIAKTKTTLKHLVNKVFTVENTYHDTNQTDKAWEQKLRREAAVIDELKRKYEC